MVHSECISEYTESLKYWKWDISFYIMGFLLQSSLAFLDISFNYFLALLIIMNKVNNKNSQISRNVVNCWGKIHMLKELQVLLKRHFKSKLKLKDAIELHTRYISHDKNSWLMMWEIELSTPKQCGSIKYLTMLESFCNHIIFKLEKSVSNA